MKKFLLILTIVLAAVGFYWFLAKNSPFETQPLMGLTFSKKWAELLGLDWRKNYLAILDELKPKAIRLPVYWDEIESEQNKLFFDDLDWQMNEALRRQVKIVLVVGYKQPRWPECFAPKWFYELSRQEKQERILVILSAAVNHFKKFSNIRYWQLENEPFFAYGECPSWRVSDRVFFSREFELAKSLDKRPILITDSGEWGLWFAAAKGADIFGTTLYRSAWHPIFGGFKYYLPPSYYQMKAGAIKLILGKNKFIISELQGEPWGPKLIHELSYEDQIKLMSPKEFFKNITFAKKIGFSEIYLWGSEWWYYLKEKQKDSRIWEEAKQIF